MKAGDKVIVIEVDTHGDYSRPFIGQVGEISAVFSNVCSVLFGDKVVILYHNEILPAKEHQVLQILRQWKRNLK